MALSLNDGQSIGKIATGDYKGKIIFIDADQKAAGQHYNEIKLGKNTLTPLPDMDKRGIYYVAGFSGSGKSYYASQLAMAYKKVYPDRLIYFFSRLPWEDDKAYAKLKPIQVDIAKVLGDNPIQSEDIEKNSLVIFDDVATINDKNLQKAVLHLMTDIMEVGRKLGLTLIITNHLINPTDKNFGRTVMNELTSLTVFPTGSYSQVYYALNTYFGMTKKEVNRIMNLPTRWITVYKTAPLVVMHQHGCFTLNKEFVE